MSRPYSPGQAWARLMVTVMTEGMTVLVNPYFQGLIAVTVSTDRGEQVAHVVSDDDEAAAAEALTTVHAWMRDRNAQLDQGWVQKLAAMDIEGA